MTGYEAAKAKYEALGVDTDRAIERLKKVPVSLHCWQLDDVIGFDNDGGLTGGIQTTGNYPGRARTPQQLMEDMEEAMKLMPGTAKLNIHASYAIYEPGEFAVGYKCVTFREDFFKGHFPQEPVMPGVLIVEALAQTGAVAILSKPENKGRIAYFGGIDKCRFKGKVQPGDKLKLEMKVMKQKGPMGVGEAVATVDGKVVVKAELTFMVG